MSTHFDKYFKFDGTNIRLKFWPRWLPWFYKRMFKVKHFGRWLELRCGDVRWGEGGDVIVLQNDVNIDDRVARHLSEGVVRQGDDIYTSLTTLGAIKPGDEYEYIYQPGSL